MKNIKFAFILIPLFSFVISCNRVDKKKIALVSFITHPVFKTIENSFKKELKKDLGNSYQLIEVNAQGNQDNLANIASQIISDNPDVIVAISTPVAQAILRAANTKTKVVYTFVSDTLNLGDELSRTNTTGLSDVINYQANLDLIKTIYGQNVRIGVLYNPNEANSVDGVKKLNGLVKNSNTKIIYSTISNESDLPIVSENLIKKVNVILSIGDNTVGAGLKTVINTANKYNVPVFAIDEGSIKELGAVGGVSVNYEVLGIETAKTVDKIIESNINPKSIKKVLLLGDKVMFNREALAKFKIKLPSGIQSSAKFVSK